MLRRVVLFTLLVQGTTASRLLHLAGVADPPGVPAAAHEATARE